MFLELFEYIKNDYNIYNKESISYFLNWSKVGKTKYPFLRISKNKSGKTLPIVPWISTSESKKYSTTILFSVKSREPFISIQSPSDYKTILDIKKVKKTGSLLLLSLTDNIPNNLCLESKFSKTSNRPKNYENVSIISESLNNKNESDIEKIIFKYEIMSKLLNKESPHKLIFDDQEFLDFENMIKTGVSFSQAKSRIGHSKWARTLKNIFGNKCAICKIDVKEILNSSHIKDWAEDEDYRGDLSNGIVFCAQHDRLFDRKLISFDSKGKILISKKISHILKELNISYENFIENKYIDGTRLQINKYMGWHRKMFKEKNK